MSIVNAISAPTRNAPVEEIRRVNPIYPYDLKKCEVHVNIGLFFDGTKNNKNKDIGSRSHSNIARLHEIYNNDQRMGFQQIYIPGVGTRFPEIGESDESNLGAGCAVGCEGRAIFGLLAVFNALHYRSYGNDFFDEDIVMTLCRRGPNGISADEIKNHVKFGTSSGLLQENIGSDSHRREFLTRQCSFLEAKLKKGKPRVVECFVDVFGFSRGAAEARVFCSWLNELLVGDRLAGVPLQFRFVGIIDTVASAGFVSGTTAFALNSTGGHGAWASAKSLCVPPSVQNCVHMIAMHELRRNFPLDAIGIGGVLQPGWVQYAYPGSHSDVGGGYRPGELGIASGEDSLKLSQIPLNHMLECAIAAGVPLTKAAVSPGQYDPLAIHPDLAKAFDDFVSQATLTPRPMYEWLQPYLNWRWQIRGHFHTTTQVKQANRSDKEILMFFNKTLVDDAAAMEELGKGRGFVELTLKAVKTVFQSNAKHKMLRNSSLEPEARSVLALSQKSNSTSPSFAVLFDGYVHDSLAGFNSNALERSGYWRYRRAFLGVDENTIAANSDSDSTRGFA